MYQTYPSGTRMSTGETGWEMQTRAVREVEAIRAAHPTGAIAIISHADVIKAIVAHYIGIHLDLFQRLVVSPASVTALWLDAWGPRLVRFNDAGPLDELELPPGHKKGASDAT